MKITFVATALAASIVLSAFTGAARSSVATPDAPIVSSLAGMREKELRWGMSHQEVTDAYNLPDGLLDREYAPRLARLQPGVEMQQLEADRDSRKLNFERSYSVFGETPSGYDVTPLHDEYTYGNDEGIQRIYKDGRTRYFFYIKDRLWKIYDEVPLKAGAPLGASYRSAVAKLGALFGVAGRVRRPDAAQKIERTTNDWQDAMTHLRAIDRSSEQLVGVVLEDKGTLSKLAFLRTSKAADPFALDPSVMAITTGGISDPNASKSRQDASTPKKSR